VTFKGAITATDLRLSEGETLYVDGALIIYKSLVLVTATSNLTVRSGGTVKGVTTGNTYIVGSGSWGTGPAGTITGLGADGSYAAGITNISDIAGGSGALFKWDNSTSQWTKVAG
jgi:hypothetical protein